MNLLINEGVKAGVFGGWVLAGRLDGLVGEFGGRRGDGGG